MAPHETVSLTTTDGVMTTYVLTPEGKGPWPAVLYYMDAFAIRPAVFEMAKHLTDADYLVLLPDLFYRHGPYETLVPKDVFARGAFASDVAPLMASTDNHKAGDTDTAALLAYLDTRSDVKGDKVGTVGFCMGGGMAISAAGFFPERVAAAVTFHGGNLASDKPVSPHLLVPKIKAELLVLGADNDHSYPPEMAEKLEAALKEAGVRHICKIYEGAAHGWTKPDFPIYNPEATARGWAEALTLFDRTLK
ncbi:MAG: dienelactone hydrolase family protein [Sphingomonadales bacterium]|nr:dienelactone hydrolase family protein [Sphingomonadales bacterium]MDE2170887.1 dienelactone hydrolase family protein [Sphingomonadales bacterium]